MVTLHWKEARIWSVNWAGEHDNKAEGKHFAESCMIYPGVHPIDDNVWEKAKKVQDVKERLESGQLVVVDTAAPTGKGTVNEQGLPKSLTRFSAADAIELVGGVMDRDVLKAWHKIEKRPAVKDAIKKQNKALEPEEDKKTE